MPSKVGHYERLAEDHANARVLAEGLAELNPDAVDLSVFSGVGCTR